MKRCCEKSETELRNRAESAGLAGAVYRASEGLRTLFIDQELIALFGLRLTISLKKLAYTTADTQLVSLKSNGSATVSDTFAKPTWLADHLIDPDVHVIEADVS